MSAVTRDILHGFEHHTWYLACEHRTRGQAKHHVAWDECQSFTELRCKRVWLTYREVTETDAEEGWLPDWSPGDKAWMGCNPDADGAVAWWEVTLPRKRRPSRDLPKTIADDIQATRERLEDEEFRYRMSLIDKKAADLNERLKAGCLPVTQEEEK